MNEVSLFESLFELHDFVKKCKILHKQFYDKFYMALIVKFGLVD